MHTIVQSQEAEPQTLRVRGAGPQHRPSNGRARPESPEEAARTPSRRRQSSRRRVAGLIGVALSLPPTLNAADILWGQNFRTVEPGRVYRSGQLSSTEIESRARELGLVGVINLRGSNPGVHWYDEEIETCDRLGIAHADIAVSARRLPPPTKLRELVEAIQTTPRPMLVHCRNGADRAGLASAITLILDSNASASDAASHQLTWWYGHIPVGPATAMDRVLALFKAGGGDDFAAWVRNDYPAIYELETKGQTR